MLGGFWTPVRSIYGYQWIANNTTVLYILGLYILYIIRIIYIIYIRIIGAEKYTLLFVSLIGFIVFDGVYISAVMNYAIQSELNISLLCSISMKVKDRGYDKIDEAIKVC